MSRRGRRKKSHGAEHPDERWLLTYADMITLLLALFIVLFAMSTIDASRFDALARTLSESFKGNVLQEQGAIITGSTGALEPNASSQVRSDATVQVMDNQDQNNAGGVSSVENKISAMVKEQKLEKSVEVTTTERGIVIRLAGDVFFESGSAAMTPKMEKVMHAIAAELVKDGRPLSIEGHTDGAPIATAQYPDNLMLSLARAATLYRFLVDDGANKDHMRAVGFADAKPVERPDYPEQSVARNRRVEIVVMAPGADVSEARRQAGVDSQQQPDVPDEDVKKAAEIIGVDVATANANQRPDVTEQDVIEQDLIGPIVELQ